jgi:hypothetical protein
VDRSRARWIRSLFRDEIGDETYHRFLAEFTQEAPIKRRMGFAREQRWKRFAESHPDLALSPAEVTSLFWVCPVHDVEIVRQRQPARWTPVRLTPEYSTAFRAFPLAGRVIRDNPTDGKPFPYVVSHFLDWRWSGDGRDGQPRDLPLEDPFWYEFCPQCAAAHDAWVAANRDLASVLVRRVMLEEYARLFPFTPEPPSREEWLTARRAEIEAKALPGDELWEWDSGGWEVGEGFAGLAVVNGGEIARQWVDRQGDPEDDAKSPDAP